MKSQQQFRAKNKISCPDGQLKQKKTAAEEINLSAAVPTYLIYQRWIFWSIIFCAESAKSTPDTILTRKVWVVSHLAKKGPECYIIIRKGDTNVQVKPGAQLEKGSRKS